MERQLSVLLHFSSSWTHTPLSVLYCSVSSSPAAGPSLFHPFSPVFRCLKSVTHLRESNEFAIQKILCPFTGNFLRSNLVRMQNINAAINTGKCLRTLISFDFCFFLSVVKHKSYNGVNSCLFVHETDFSRD